MDNFWPEVAEYISQIESLSEDKAFPGRELAALVASKVFFHLEQYDEAVRLALAAGEQFNLLDQSDYTDTIITKVVDEYILRKDSGSINERLRDFIERMFSRCLSAGGDLKSGLGISIEARRMDWTRKFIQASKGTKLIDLLKYCQEHVRSFVAEKSVRTEVLQIMVDGYHDADGKDKDWMGVTECLYFLGRSADVSGLFDELLGRSDEDDWGYLMAAQLAFDLADHDDQKFCAEVASALKTTDETKVSKIKSILSYEVQVNLGLEFLFRNNKTDLLLLETLRSTIDQRSSVLHNGVVVTHSLMQAGTTNDAFLRKNLDWLARSSHWAKFTATASLGVIHKGHLKDSRNLLSTYLPPQTGGGQSAGRSPYSEGGAFYALGLIHANHYDEDTELYLRNCLTSSQGNEVLQVGASLGLGLTCMGTKSMHVYEALRSVLFLDSAVAGEGAGYGIGLVMAGSGNEQVLSDLLAYAHETHHEKIVRACCVAIALVLFEQEQAADQIINQMINDNDAIIRYGGMFAIGMAYCGTSQNSAVKQLLHHSVSDVNDDVRRAAVISLGLVLSNEPTQLPKVLKLLSQSYNPHVRYAVCLAMGIGCPAMAATVPGAVELIEPLLTDVSEFVRQGALIGMALVCQETSGKQVDGKAQKFRQTITKMIGEKHQDIMCRFGAVLAHGLVDMGGRNCAVSLFTKRGSLRMGAAVGFCLFAQMWYWYPLMLMVSLASHPTALIGLNGDLKMPKQFAVKSKAKPSMFAYPPEHKVEQKADKSRLTSAVLSAAKGRKKTKEEEEAEAKDIEMKEVQAAKEKEAQEPNEEILYNPCRVVPAQENVVQFFRVGDAYAKKDGAEGETVQTRYTPVVTGRTSGFVLLMDSRKGEEDELLEASTGGDTNMKTEAEVAAQTAQAAQPATSAPVAEEEAPPPEAFEWEG